MRKLIVKNNWKNLAFFAGKKKIPVGTPELTIKFPDGTIEKTKIFWREETGTVSDMGTEYPYVTHFPVIVRDYHGIEIDIPLEEGLEVEL